MAAVRKHLKTKSRTKVKRVTSKKVRAGTTNPEELKPQEMYERALRLAEDDREAHANEVVLLLEGAANAGHAKAAHALATWYIHGIGVRKNFKKAVALETVAARSGITEALYNLAFAYETGRGTKKDEAKAFQLYREAARDGDADAMHEVGRCLYYGIGTPKNERLGRRWIDRSTAAEKGSGVE